MSDDDEDEEELRAALLARKALRAELEAGEKSLLTRAGLAPSSSSVEDFKPKFVSKLLREQQPPVPAVPAPTKRPSVAPPVAAVAKPIQQPSHRPHNSNSKRLKFEWDETEDTSLNYYYHSTNASASAAERDARLLEQVDHRQAKSEQNAVDVGSKPLGDMTARDWRIIRENFDIHIRRTDATTSNGLPNPARNWDEMNLPPKLRQRIDQVGYTSPTPIQMQAVPIAAAPGNTDMIGQAETGSGKTAAFVIPFLLRLDRDPFAQQRKTCHENGPLGLILAPTRELVHQIHEEIGKLCSTCRSCAVVGGNSAEDQGFLLREGVDVVVATPGRLLDLLANRVCVLNHCEYVVLDEADRMIDMGFEAQVNKVLDSLVVPRALRTTLMFSATMDPSVIRMAQHYMKPSPAVVCIGDDETGKNTNIDQHIVGFSSEAGKESALMGLLAAGASAGPVIVFCNAKLACDQLVRAIRQRGLLQQACAFHSNLSQSERESNLKRFKDGAVQVLVATDVAGRGLDVDNVAHVINYDCPSTLQRYTHRIGRTGRAGKRGKATTFVVGGGVDSPEVLGKIQKYLEQTGHAPSRDLKEAIGDSSMGHNIQD